MTDGRLQIREMNRGGGPGIAVLDRVEREARRILDELARAREEVERLKARVLELEGAAPDRADDGGRLQALEEENRALRVKLEKVERKSREILKKLDVIREV
jgi:predicted RNase H-like nuclease (RuvC/YqgF family)